MRVGHADVTSTLHAVPNGNARSVVVPPEALNFDNLVKVQP